MADISKHNSKKEWKSDLCDHRWICFFVGWHTVCVRYHLENVREFIGVEMSWRIYLRIVYFFKLNVQTFLLLLKIIRLLPINTHLIIRRRNISHILKAIRPNHGLQLQLIRITPYIAIQNVSFCLHFV